MFHYVFFFLLRLIESYSSESNFFFSPLSLRFIWLGLVYFCVLLNLALSAMHLPDLPFELQKLTPNVETETHSEVEEIDTECNVAQTSAWQRTRPRP